MGKTKTAFISDLDSEQKSGKEAYAEKMKKKAEKQAQLEREKAKVGGLGLKGGERIKVVGASEEASPSVEPDTSAEAAKTVKERVAKVRGKKYKESIAKFDRSKHYSLDAAVKLVKETSYTKFDGTVELHVVTKSEINRQVDLPFLAGKTKKIEIASDSTIEKLKSGHTDFDVLLATPDMMPKLVPFAKVLGPRGLMPNPKNGTLIKSAKEAERFSGNSTTIKTQKDHNVVHLAVGKVSQKESEIVKNISVVFDAIDKKKIERAFISPTMGPSFKLQVN